MKFGRKFEIKIDNVPGWGDMYMSYKELKRLVRLIPRGSPSPEEAEFLNLLSNEIDKFNAFFVEKEEEFVIRHQELQQNMKRAIELWGPNGSQPSERDYKEKKDVLMKDIVDLHGQMVLLINFCNNNYRGLGKILKKYEKRTGRIRCVPFIQKVLEHPFLTNELISKLVRECESIIDEVW